MVSFSRVSSVLCFGCHVVGSTRCSGNSAGLLRCRVTSPGKLSSPLKSLSSLFCGVTALARSWTSLVGFVVRVQRAGFQVSLARVGARSYEFRSTRELQAREEREHAHSRVVLNCPGWTSPTGGWSNQSVGTGQSPACTTFLQGTFMWRKITFTHVLKLLSGLHIYNITTFVILLIHTFLQPFIKV